MRDVADLSVTQYYLYAPGRVPFAHLSTRQALDTFRTAFAFREASPLLSGVELVFEGGAAQSPEKGLVTIRRLHIGDRRILLDVAAESATAEAVSALVHAQVAKLDPTDRFASSKPVSVRQETTCTALLDVAWDRFLNPALVQFLEKTFARVASDDEATVTLNTLKLRFLYDYQVQSAAVRQYGITLAPKPLIVEPVVDTPLTEQRYFTTSPTDSATHLKLLADLEKSLG